MQNFLNFFSREGLLTLTQEYLFINLNMYQMYVPGTLENTKTVLVNVGTGYYVEKVKKECSYYYYLSGPMCTVVG